jgi:hypothetical protein
LVRRSHGARERTILVIVDLVDGGAIMVGGVVIWAVIPVHMNTVWGKEKKIAVM